MKREAGGPCLSAVFVDYDNIYLSLKRKSEEAAKRFAKEAGRWVREIENGNLITATNASFGSAPRRIAMNRCYGNPVPRRNPSDNSTDMSSFPFVRHHFLRAGFEVIDCPPLTAQLKNSADIRMVMDIRDLLLHDTYFDEFIILSGDADFTPVLIRLRAHARRTVVFANDFTAAPYTAICDGEVRETALIDLILAGDAPDGSARDEAGAPSAASRIEEVRREILAEVVAGVRASATPVPLEALADRALRALGHERTIATGWAGAGSFRELLRRNLPAEIRLTGDPPYLAYDVNRHRDDRLTAEAEAAVRAPAPEVASRTAPEPPAPHAAQDTPPEPAGVAARAPAYAGMPSEPPRPTDTEAAAAALRRVAAYALAEAGLGPQPEAPATAQRTASLAQPPAVQHTEPPASHRLDAPSPIQQSIARIQEACQAPPLAPQEYRVLFEIMAKEINEHDLFGVQTLANIAQRAHERGIELRRDDVRFVLEVVSEADPWFEQGASADVFASRFRTFVVARCRGQGLDLTADELDLIDAWFLGGGVAQRLALRGASRAIPAPQGYAADDSRGSRQGGSRGAAAAAAVDEFPRVARTRLRG